MYPVARGGVFLFLPLLGFLVFRERLDATGWLSLALIVAGIVRPRCDVPVLLAHSPFDRYDRPMTRHDRIGAFAWLFTLQFFMVQVIVQSAWTTPFSLAHNMISDLGRETCGLLSRAPNIEVACSPWHALMNASIMANGFLIPLGAWLTRRSWPATRIMVIALAMIALTAPGHVLVGGWPSDTGPTMHLIGAGSILALGNPGMVVAGLALWTERRAEAVVSLVLGVAGIAGTLLFLNETGLGIGLGGMERVAFYPLTLWCGLLGIALLRRESSSTPLTSERAGVT